MSLEQILAELKEINKEAEEAATRVRQVQNNDLPLNPVTRRRMYNDQDMLYEATMNEGINTAKTTTRYSDAVYVNTAEEQYRVVDKYGLNTELQKVIASLRSFNEAVIAARQMTVKSGERFTPDRAFDSEAVLLNYKQAIEYSRLLNNLAVDTEFSSRPGGNFGVMSDNLASAAYFPKSKSIAVEPQLLKEDVSNIVNSIIHEVVHSQDAMIRTKSLTEGGRGIAERNGVLNTKSFTYAPEDPYAISGYRPNFFGKYLEIVRQLESVDEIIKPGTVKNLVNNYGWEENAAKQQVNSEKDYFTKPTEILARNASLRLQDKPLEIEGAHFANTIDSFIGMMDKEALNFLNAVKQVTPQFVNSQRNLELNTTPSNPVAFLSNPAISSLSQYQYQPINMSPGYGQRNPKLIEQELAGAKTKFADMVALGDMDTAQKWAGTIAKLEQELKDTLINVEKLKQEFANSAKNAEEIPNTVKNLGGAGGGGVPPEIPATPAAEDPGAARRKLETLLAQGTRGRFENADINKVINDLLAGKQVTAGMRMGGGAYLTKSEDVIKEIDAVVKELRELESNYGKAADAAGNVAKNTEQAAKETAQFDEDLRNIPINDELLAAAQAQDRQNKLNENPGAMDLQERFPRLKQTVGEENYANLENILSRAEATAKTGPLGGDVDKVSTSLKQLDDNWFRFTRTVENSNKVLSQSNAYLDKAGNIFDEAGYKAKKYSDDIARANAEQTKILQSNPNISGIQGYLEKRGLPIGGTTAEGMPVQTTVTQLPQKYGGDIVKVNSKALTEQGKILREVTLYTNQYGDIITAANHRVQNFSESIVHNTSELFRWSIGIGLLYGGMYRLQQAFQQTIQNETLLADVTVTLGLAQRSVTDIFNDAAKVAKETGESVTEVLQTYKSAYTAVGGIADPIERTAAANKLLYDSTVLNKLAGIDAAAAIDTLSGALRQTAGANETAVQSFDRGTEMLDQWVRLSTKANVDLGTLATAFSITAESALNTGMTIKELNAVIATLSEKIGGLGGKETGNAVRALIGGVYQDQAATALNKYGIAVTDTTGKMRNFMDISRDIYMMYKEGLISEDQITALAYTLGGGVRRGQQYLAYLTDYQRIQENINVQNNSAGAAQLALSQKMDTTQTEIVKMNNAFLTLTQTLGNEGGVLDLFQSLLHVGEGLANVINSIAKGLGNLTIPVTLMAALQAYMAIGKTPAMMRINTASDLIGKAVGGATGRVAQGASFVGGALTGTRGINAAETSQISTLIASYVSKYAMGTIIGSLPAIARFQQGTKEGNIGGAADIGGAIVGSIIGGLAGPAGSMIGGVIGGAIADIFIADVLAAKIDISRAFTWETPPTPSSPKVVEQQKKNVQVDIYKGLAGPAPFWFDDLTKEYMGRLRVKLTQFTSSISPSPRPSYGTRPEDTIPASEIKNWTQDQWAAYLYRRFQKQTGYEQLKQQAAGVPVEQAALPEWKQSEYTYYKTEEEIGKALEGHFERIAEQERQALKDQLTKGEIKPSDYRQGLEATYTAADAASRTVAALNDELKSQVGINKELKLTVDDVLNAYLKSSPEAISSLNQITNQIIDNMNEMDKLKQVIAESGPQKLVTPKTGGEDVEAQALLVKLQLETSDLEDQAMAALSSMKIEIQQSEASKIKLAPMIDVSKMKLSVEQINKAFEEAVEKERAQFKYQLSVGQITQEQYDALINQAAATKTFVWLGGQLGGWMKQGLLASNFLQEALNEQAAKVNVPFEIMDYPLQTIINAANSPMYYAMQAAITAAGGNAEEEQKVVVSSGSPTNPLLMSKNWAIVQYLLSQILKTEEKQLEGIYNLPGGASFYVPFDAYKMGYANKGGGLSNEAVGANTQSTTANTEATNRLTTVLSQITRGITWNPNMSNEQRKSIIDDWRTSKKEYTSWEQQLHYEAEAAGGRVYGPADRSKDWPTKTTKAPMTTVPTTTPTVAQANIEKTIPYYASAEPKTEKLYQPPAAIPTGSVLQSLQSVIENLINWLSGNKTTPESKTQVPSPIPPAGLPNIGGSAIEALIALLAPLLSSRPQEPTVSNVRLQDKYTPAYEPTMGGDTTEGLLSSINAGIQSMVSLLRIQNTKQTQPGGLLDKNTGNYSSGTPQITVSVQPQPIKVDFSATTILTVDGAVLASVVMPYVYAALVAYNGSQGGATRSYTSI